MIYLFATKYWFSGGQYLIRWNYSSKLFVIVYIVDIIKSILCCVKAIRPLSKKWLSNIPLYA